MVCGRMESLKLTDIRGKNGYRSEKKKREVAEVIYRSAKRQVPTHAHVDGVACG